MYFTSLNLAADRVLHAGHNHKQNPFTYLNKIHMLMEVHLLLGLLENGATEKSEFKNHLLRMLTALRIPSAESESDFQVLCHILSLS